MAQTTTFEGVSGLSETRANVTATVQSGGTTVNRSFTLLDYSSVTGPLTSTQYGQITDSTSPPPTGTTREVWSPPRADNRATLALNASTDVAWTTSGSFTPTGGAAQPLQTTARNNRITYRGQESVVVPAGTFVACRFDITETPVNSERIEWIAVGTQAPVKITSSPGTANEGSFELTGTSRLNGNPL